MPLVVRLLHGDCMERLGEIPPNEIYAVVTDPPYGLVLHRANWDAPWLEPDEKVPSDEVESFDPTRFQGWSERWLHLCFDRLPAGGLLKVFSATRTAHRMMAAMAKIGFTDIGFEAWVRGQTLPRGMDIGKAFARQAEVEPRRREKAKLAKASQNWAGWNTMLKTSWEFCVVGRKP